MVAFILEEVAEINDRFLDDEKRVQELTVRKLERLAHLKGPVLMTKRCRTGLVSTTSPIKSGLGGGYG